MNKIQLKIVQAACKAIRNGSRAGNKRIVPAFVSTRATAHYLRLLFSFPPLNKRRSSVDLQPNLAIFDLGCALHLHLLVSVHSRISIGSQAPTAPAFLWLDKDLYPKPEFVLLVLLTNSFNSLCGIRELCLCGLDNQARILLRSYVEISDLALAVIAFEDVFRAYASTQTDVSSSIQNWQRHLTPAVIRQRLTLWVTTKGMERRLAASLETIRRSTYQWLSSFTHANWGAQAQAVAAFPRNAGRRSTLRLGITKRVSANSRPTLLHAVEYMSFQLLLIRLILEWEHQWNLENFPDGHLLVHGMAVFDAAISENWNEMRRLRAFGRGDSVKKPRNPFGLTSIG